MDVYAFWNAVLAQDAERIRPYFAACAYVNWHCTNERFTVEEFIRANCEYPGEWEGTVERVEQTGDVTVAVVNVYPPGRECSFHAVSFLKTQNGKIVAIDEYWGDDGPAPRWRAEKRIGSAIK